MINGLRKMENNTIEIFEKIQNDLSLNIKLKNNFNNGNLRLVAGVDLAYLKVNVANIKEKEFLHIAIWRN
ncbi:hypothetical protein D3C73_1014290 [compost metagenome]